MMIATIFREYFEQKAFLIKLARSQNTGSKGQNIYQSNPEIDV
jgi:hypothetical protein